MPITILERQFLDLVFTHHGDMLQPYNDVYGEFTFFSTSGEFLINLIDGELDTLLQQFIVDAGGSIGGTLVGLEADIAAIRELLFIQNTSLLNAIKTNTGVTIGRLDTVNTKLTTLGLTNQQILEQIISQGGSNLSETIEAIGLILQDVLFTIQDEILVIQETMTVSLQYLGEDIGIAISNNIMQSEEQQEGTAVSILDLIGSITGSIKDDIGNLFMMLSSAVGGSLRVISGITDSFGDIYEFVSKEMWDWIKDLMEIDEATFKASIANMMKIATEAVKPTDFVELRANQGLGDSNMNGINVDTQSEK